MRALNWKELFAQSRFLKEFPQHPTSYALGEEGELATTAYKVWVGKCLKYLPALDISRRIGQEKSQALLTFHTFTDCDQTSYFAHYGKKTA